MLITTIGEVLCLMGPPLPVGTGSTDMEKGANLRDPGTRKNFGIMEGFSKCSQNIPKSPNND